MDIEERYKSHRKNQILWSMLIFLLAILVLIILPILLPLLGFNPPEHYFRDKFIDALFCSVMTIGFFTIFYDFIARNRMLDELQLSVIKAITNKKDIIIRFSPNEINNIIRNCINAILNEDRGNLLFDNIVTPYLASNTNFRSDFRYIVTIDDIKSSAMFVTDKNLYYDIHQNICYSKIYNKGAISKLSIGFAYDEQTLDQLLTKDELFFREILFLNEVDLNVLKAMDEDGILNLCQTTFNFSAFYYCNGKEVEIGKSFVKVKKEPNGFILSINLLEIDRSLCSNDKQKFKIKFHIPQLKTRRHFLIAIPEPTENPFIQFIHSDKMKVVPFAFFSDDITCDYDNNIFIFEFKKWVFPRSGVLFTWD